MTRDTYASARVRMPRQQFEFHPDLHVQVDFAEQALAEVPGLYRRGDLLVEVFDGPCVHSVNKDRLLELISASAEMTEPLPGGGRRPKWFPQAVAKALVARPGPGIPNLREIAGAPFVQADGSVIEIPGYDPLSQTILAPRAEFPAIQREPTRPEAMAATARLLDLVAEFPFVEGTDRSAWLALILSRIGRRLYEGDAPMFLITAEEPDHGKTLLADLASSICEGQPAARCAHSHDDDETRKRITALALAGASFILVDNIDTSPKRGREQSFANAALNAAITCRGVWQDRKLGRSESVRIPLRATWVGTGNSLRLLPDTARRCCVVELDRPGAKPTAFRQPRLFEHVNSNWAGYYVDAMTALLGYLAAGSPTSGQQPIGSFESWQLIRDCVIWLGEPDPGLGIYKAQNQTDRVCQRDDRARGVIFKWIDRVLASAKRPMSGHDILVEIDESIGVDRVDFEHAICRYCQLPVFGIDGVAMARLLTEFEGVSLPSGTLRKKRTKRGNAYYLEPTAPAIRV